MSLAVVYSRASVGIQAPQVTVEAHLSNGIPQFAIVGLPETAVKESKDRVRSALLESGFEFPAKRITVNLAPADLPKEGGRFDLPIAISILLASFQLRCPSIHDYELAGELGLSGTLRAIKGVLPFALATQNTDRQLIIPEPNAIEATWVSPLTIYAFRDFLSVCGYLSGQQQHTPVFCTPPPVSEQDNTRCFSEICGQSQAKRALEVAAAGGHSLLMIGPPGTGKTMLASRLDQILPPLSQSERLEVAALYSISRSGFHNNSFWKRPFRHPHHTASAVSLVGGGRQPIPGEISLAHHGVLFLDELPEFSRNALEVLREPLESGVVYISRAAGQAQFPANCQLIAAMNPCPCGYLSDRRKNCTCSNEQIHRYRSKISGPLLDRIDIQIEVPALSPAQLSTFDPTQEETSKTIQQRVIAARTRQHQRCPCINSKMGPREIAQFCAVQPSSKAFFQNALEKLAISARAYHRILKVARTIADLSDSPHIETPHLAEAIQFRKYDRTLT